MNCIENISFLGVLQETYLLPQFYRKNKFDGFISFTMTRHTASHTVFFKFLNNKHLRRKLKFYFKKITVFAYLFLGLHVFTGKRLNIKKMVCDGLGNSISCKMMPVSAS